MSNMFHDNPPTSDDWLAYSIGLILLGGYLLYSCIAG